MSYMYDFCPNGTVEAFVEIRIEIYNKILTVDIFFLFFCKDPFSGKVIASHAGVFTGARFSQKKKTSSPKNACVGG